ncbi:MAG: DNA-binding protein WhiA [Oscillospiraceae bacterium]|jgi:DNA-binding protein WhiA|nr:DNA-binding protein WhiA [Oscillospiraceae bacterium]
MSFSREIKAELCRSEPCCGFCAAAECYGILLYCNKFSAGEIKIVTETRALADRLPVVFERAFGVAFDSMPGDGERAGKHAFAINVPDKLDVLFETYGLARGGIVAHHINLGVLESECCRRGFIRGAFLAGGSITDPDKRYHLELVTGHYSVNGEMRALLLEQGFEPKALIRNGNYVVYFKHSGAIEDFLTLIGAPLAAMKLMSAKIEKSMRNSVNRLVNCDTANVSKTVEAAQQQIEAITKLSVSGALGDAPEKLRRAAELRIAHPELSIAQLGEMSVPPVSKSCFYHRIRKLLSLCDQTAPDKKDAPDNAPR